MVGLSALTSAVVPLLLVVFTTKKPEPPTCLCQGAFGRVCSLEYPSNLPGYRLSTSIYCLYCCFYCYCYCYCCCYCYCYCRCYCYRYYWCCYCCHCDCNLPPLSVCLSVSPSLSIHVPFLLRTAFFAFLCKCRGLLTGDSDAAANKAGMIDKFSTGRRRLRENIAQKTGKEAADNSEFEERWQPIMDLRDKVRCWVLGVGYEVSGVGC